MYSSIFVYLVLLLLFLCGSDSRPAPFVEVKSPSWQNFQRFIDAGRGSEFSGMSNLKKYFHHFGYLNSSMTAVNFTDVFDEHLEAAVTLYQSKFGLPVTGKLDSTTVEQLSTPRCGVSDTTIMIKPHPSSIHTTKHFAYFSGQPRWDRGSLTYAFTNHVNYLDQNDVRAVFRRAFSRWASVIPVSFTEVNDPSTADIRIGFHSGDHGDGEPFDGVLGVLAHAFSPDSGRLHLDEAETWAVDFGREKASTAVDLESVATHEIGHVLGLAHSGVKEAIMYPSLSPRTKKVDLKVDDVEGVQALYGSNPDFKLSSLLESEMSPTESDGGIGPRRFGAVAAAGVVMLMTIIL